MDSYCQILDLLADGHLLQAIRLQKEQVSELQNWPLMDELVKTEETYTLMLKYFAEGAADARRSDIYDDAVRRTLAMAEKIKRQKGFRDSVSTYYSKLRTVARQGRTLIYYSRRLQMLSQHQLLSDILDDDNDGLQESETSERSRAALVEQLFDYVWVAGQMTEEEYETLESLFAGSVLTGGEKMWLVSSLTLSLLSYYDQPKLSLLVNLAESYSNSAPSDDSVIYSRAIVGIALAAMYYRRRFSVDHSITPLLIFMPGIGSLMAMLQIQFLVQYQTHRIRQTFDHDFMSLINQMRGKITDMEELRNMLEDEDPELPPGIDPDVVRAIQSRLHQASDMAHRGLDMMYHHFRQLKAYPFFRETRNWLKPTQVPTPDFSETLRKMAPLFGLSRMCDSDKHSMAATLASMPQTLGQMLSVQMQELDLNDQSPADQLKEERAQTIEKFNLQYSDISLIADVSPSLAFAGSYLQDLYRLFLIRMEKEEEANPFKTEPDMLFIDSPLIQPLLSAQEAKVVIDYACRCGLHRHALTLINAYFAEGAVPSDMLVSQAFCYAMVHDYQSAVETFRHCEDQLDTDMLTVYASCLMSAGYPDEAVRIYEKLNSQTLELSNSHPLSLYPYAVALSQTGRYADACKALYQEDYQHPDQVKVVRLLAWCSLQKQAQSGSHSTQNEKAPTDTSALKEFQRLLTMHPLRSADWLNAGHAALAAGQTGLAMDYYLRSEAKTLTDTDRTLLTRLGVLPLTVRIVTDVLEKHNSRE